MNQFDSVKVRIPDKNVFTLDHDIKASYNFDKLYPFLVQPIYPGDTWNCRAEVLMRSMPLLAPLMHKVDLRMYFFFVPNRLIWNENKKDDWKVFITGGEKGTAPCFDENNIPVFPHWTYKLVEDAVTVPMNNGSLIDHMGFPTPLDSEINESVGVHAYNVRISSLPFRAYTLIWNEYFRNQNLQNEVEFSYGSGLETAGNLRKIMAFRKKCWEKDYFTSCLPFAQRGQAVTLPIEFTGGDDVEESFTGNVTINKAINKTTEGNNSTMHSHSSGGTEQFIAVDNTKFSNDDVVELSGTATGTVSIDAAELAFTGLSIGTINDFRACLRLQQWLENNARCGSRYIEQLFAHFGVTSSDARLQRPELLGGGVIPLLFTDVAQTSFGDGDSDNVLGDLAGKGTLYGKTEGFKKYFEEHGILMGLLCIVPRTSYWQGIPRWTTLFDKTDWYFPEFANLGEQAVYQKEVYFNPKEAASYLPDDVFGYQGRFTELRYIPSTVHGEMRGTLQSWHLGRFLNPNTTLNSGFVEAQSRVNVFAMSDVSTSGYDPFVAHIHMDISAVRPLPKYAIPTL